MTATPTSGTMMIPPICCAVRGSLTRALTMTPATTDARPTAGPRRKTPASHESSVTTRTRPGLYRIAVNPMRATYVTQPTNTPGSNAEMALPARSSIVRMGVARTASRLRDVFSPMIEYDAIESGM